MRQIFSIISIGISLAIALGFIFATLVMLIFIIDTYMHPQPDMWLLRIILISGCLMFFFSSRMFVARFLLRLKKGL